MGNGKINQTDIMRRGIFHQLLPQMVDCRIFLVVFPVRVIPVHKKRIRELWPITIQPFLIFPYITALFQPQEESWIDLIDLLCKKPLQVPDPFMLPLKPSPRTADSPSLPCSLGSREKGGSDRGFPVLFQDMVICVCYAPANCAGTQVQP